MLFRPQPRFDHVLHGDARVNGTLCFAGALLMEGQITGPVQGQGSKTTLLVRGSIVGDVTATHVFVEGQITGNITADILEIKAKGRVMGNVSVRSLHLEEGGALEGKIETAVSPVPNAQAATPASSPNMGTASIAFERLKQVTGGDQAERIA
jgi:cytoskeletal protein CcmA (bactofilin family)